MQLIETGKVYGIDYHGQAFCMECFGPLTVEMVNDPQISAIPDRKPHKAKTCCKCRRMIRG
jgi:hypothetical protein